MCVGPLFTCGTIFLFLSAYCLQLELHCKKSSESNVTSLTLWFLSCIAVLLVFWIRLTTKLLLHRVELRSYGRWRRCSGAWSLDVLSFVCCSKWRFPTLYFLFHLLLVVLVLASSFLASMAMGLYIHFCWILCERFFGELLYWGEFIWIITTIIALFLFCFSSNQPSLFWIFVAHDMQYLRKSFSSSKKKT